MARTSVSDEEIQLRKRARRRLVGAIALVLAAVVVLPMVLDGEPQQHPQEISVEIPPIPADGPAGAALPPATAVETGPTESQRLRPSVPQKPSEPLPSSAASDAGENLVIQIGCFSNPGKSRDLVNQIRANKIPAFSTPAPGDAQACMRVRAGPFPTEEAARRARERLLALKLIPPPSEGKIVRRGE